MQLVVIAKEPVPGQVKHAPLSAVHARAGG